MKYKIEINVDVPDKCGDIRDKLYGLFDADSGPIADISKYVCRRQENEITWDVRPASDDLFTVKDKNRNYSSLDLFLKLFKEYSDSIKDKSADKLKQELTLRDLNVLANTVRKAMNKDFK
jgi:hypothetical protein